MSGGDVGEWGGKGCGKGGNTCFGRSMDLCPGRVPVASESRVKGGGSSEEVLGI